MPVVLTMGATNAPEALDPALLRPGRFDRRVVVNPPSAAGRREIIEYYLSKVTHDPNLNIDHLVADTIGYTPVAIKHVINEALILAHFDGRDALTYADFTKAREVHEMGLPNPNPTMTDEDKRRVAYHEAGHAVAMHYLRPHERVVRVTIQPHGSSGGFVAPKPKVERARYAQSKEELLAEIKVSLASRAAEHLFLDTELIGVGGDFGRATALAVQAVAQWGMAGEIFSEAAIPVGNGISPYVRRRAEQILQQCLREVTDLLAQEADLVDAVAKRVMEKWEIDGQEFEALVAEVEAQRANGVSSILTYLHRLHDADGPIALENGDGQAAISAISDSPLTAL